MRGFTGIVAFDVGSIERAREVAEATRIFALAESLGAVESLIGHPALMTHASIPAIERAREVAEATRIFALAESLGGVESLIGHPALMTHASIPAADRERMGVTDGLLRLSCGIEDGDDLIKDLDRALRQVS